MTAKTLETALNKVIALPDAVQEEIGRELLARIAALESLRFQVQIGADQLDAGLGRELDIEDIIRDARREHAEK